jgi:LmbE family N-acetylglucosaminyl deacetylase
VSKRAFAVGAHPDDIEFLMAGTLILLKEAGYEIHYMNVANGSCGSVRHDAETIIKIRREEASSAAALIGATFHESLVNDMEVLYEKETLSRLGSVVREVGPEIMLLHSPSDYMEDHQNASRLAVTAAFCRGAPNFPVEPPRAAIDKDVTVYHAQPHGNRDGLWSEVVPEIFVDVSGVMDTKTAMLGEHRSQKEWLDKSQGMDSYLAAMEDMAREVGRLSGRYEFAEGWRRRSHLGFCSEDANPLVDALKESCLVRGGNRQSV